MLVKCISGIPNAVISVPSSGEYKIIKIRLDGDKKIVLTYDETPEP